MAFTGDLEHLPIIDVIQLLNTTRKSGTLTVYSDRGECRLVFSIGHIVSANYLNSRVRIGQVLVKMGALTDDDLNKALEVQKSAGSERKPLIATLIDMGIIKQEDAHVGLKKLVEMTVVELVEWKSGSFTLDTEEIVASGECSYNPADMEQGISLDSQMILMDALRIFDEKQRDGSSTELIFSEEEIETLQAPEGTAVPEDSSFEISADLLGLDNLDKLERKIPGVFSSIRDVDPSEAHRQVVKDALPSFPEEKQEKMVSFLVSHSGGYDHAREGSHAWGIILLSRDELIKHSLGTLCKKEGVMVFSTADEGDIDPIIDQYLLKKIVPILVFDGPMAAGDESAKGDLVKARRSKRERYPQIPVIQLLTDMDYDFILNSYKDGVKTVFPRPSREESPDAYVGGTILFLESLLFYARGVFNEQGRQLFRKMKESILELQEFGDSEGITFAVLNYVSQKFQRAITFLVEDSNLLAERGIGVQADKSEGVTPPMNFKIPIDKDSVISQVVSSGELFYGESSDEALKKNLFQAIGAPQSPNVLLLPTRVRRKTMFITYADFGQEDASLVQPDDLEIFSSQAGLVLENVQYRS